MEQIGKSAMPAHDSHDDYLARKQWKSFDILGL